MARLKTQTRRRIVVTVFILGVVGAFVWAFVLFFRPLPDPVLSGDIYRPDQGWDDESRRWYYSASQGTLVIPYDWFVALEQPDSQQSIIAPEYFTRFRLIPNPDPQFNPDRLPVGLTVASHPVTGRRWLSFTCAMCHTGQLEYRGLSIRIDGAPSQQDFNAYTQEMILSLALTRFIPSRFHRFARRVLEDDYTPSAAFALWSDLKEFIRSTGPRALQQEIEHIYPTDSGFGRVDALGTGANGMMYQLSPDNELVSDGPVSNPPLWWTHDYDWVQSVAAIEQPLGRNMVEAMGVNAYVDLTGGEGNIAPIGVEQEPGSSPEQLFLSSVDLRNMYLMEEMLSALEPPKWPEEILGEIDPERAARGRELYEEMVFENALSPREEQLFPFPDETEPRRGLCARCHGPQLTPPNTYDKQFVKLKVYKLDVIGTDPQTAENFAARQVQIERGVLVDREEEDVLGIGDALGQFSSAVQERRFEELWEEQGYYFFPGDGADDIPLYQGFRPNRFRAPLGYPARPMGGYWATAPYLHNGSVPDLYELLSPVSERSEVFYTGNLEFDPVHVGYRSEKFRGGFRFDTSITGNSNAGHEFRDAPKGTPGVIGPYLPPEDRLAIIEYMKVIDDFPDGSVSEAERARRLRGVTRWKHGSPPRYPAPGSETSVGAGGGGAGAEEPVQQEGTEPGEEAGR